MSLAQCTRSVALASMLSLVACQSATQTEQSQACTHYDAALSQLSGYGQQEASGARRVLRQLIPSTCAAQRQALADFEQSLEEAPYRRVGLNNALELAEAPPAPNWSVEVWPQRLSEEMMVAHPSRAQVLREHPRRALQRERIGSTVLEGRVLPDGKLVWRILNEYPEGWGFGEAAVRVADSYRAPLEFEDGRSTLGAQFLTVISFTRTPDRPIIQY